VIRSSLFLLSLDYFSLRYANIVLQVCDCRRGALSDDLVCLFVCFACKYTRQRRRARADTQQKRHVFNLRIDWNWLSASREKQQRWLDWKPGGMMAKCFLRVAAKVHWAPNSCFVWLIFHKMTAAEKFSDSAQTKKSWERKLKINYIKISSLLFILNFYIAFSYLTKHVIQINPQGSPQFIHARSFLSLAHFALFLNINSEFAPRMEIWLINAGADEAFRSNKHFPLAGEPSWVRRKLDSGASS